MGTPAAVDDVQRQDLLCSTNEDFDFIFLLDDASIAGFTGYLSIYESWAAKEAGSPPLFALTPTAGMTTNESDKTIEAVIAQGTIAAAVSVSGSPHGGHFAPQKTFPYDLLILDGTGKPARSLVGNVIVDLGLTAAS